MNNIFSVDIENGKYTVIQGYDGDLKAFRYGEFWRDLCGDKLVGALARELLDCKQERRDLLNMLKMALIQLQKSDSGSMLALAEEIDSLIRGMEK